MVRGDRGVENSTVAFMQPFLRRNGTDGLSDQNSFQYGRSASNQVCTNLFTIDLKNYKDSAFTVVSYIYEEN